MANIITTKTRYYRDVKPSLGSQINWSHPLSRGLVGCWLMNEGGGKKIRNYASNSYGLLDGTTMPLWIPNGISFVNGSVNNGDINISSSLTSMSFVFKFTANSVSAEQAIISKWGNAANLREFLLEIGSDAKIGLVFSTSGGGLNGWRTAGTISANREYTCAVVWHGAKIFSFYLNGVRVAGEQWFDGTLTVTQNTIANLRIGIADDGKNFGGKIRYANFFNRALSLSEIQQLYEAPYQFIAPIRNRLIFPISGEQPVAPTYADAYSSIHYF